MLNPLDDQSGLCERLEVTDQDQTGTPAPRRVQCVRIVQLSPTALHALADGDLDSANEASCVPMTAYFAGPDWRGLWRRRSRQVLRDPGSAAWITGVIWDVQQQVAVGRAGYHGPPDSAGMIEIGYAVDPIYRRKGFARAALVTLLERAAGEPDVRTVRATFSPENAASRDLILQYGFAHVGEQWDDEDGLELVYEVTAQLHQGPTS